MASNKEEQKPISEQLEILRDKVKRGTWDIDYVVDHWLPARLERERVEARIDELKNLQMSEVEDLVKDEVFEHYIKNRLAQLKGSDNE